MARSDQVKALVRSHREGDEQRFRRTAEEIIEDARRRRHGILADELEAILDEPVRTQRPAKLATLRPLPKGRDDTSLLEIRQPDRTLHDVVLSPTTREVLMGLITEQRSATALHAYGIKPRRSVLFAGPSGTGKSATAEAIAGELGWPIARVQLATVVSSYLGETAKNLDQIFSFLQSGSWVSLFDEFDMLARDRGDRTDHGELKRVVGALLQLIESTTTDSLIIATSNHPSLLDGALWRRFDEIVGFELPNSTERAALLDMKLHGVHHQLDTSVLAATMDGYSQADVESVALDSIRLMVQHLDHELSDQHVAYGIDRMEERRRIIRNSQG